MANSALGELARAAREATLPPARLLTDEDRKSVVAEIYDGGRLTPAYGFMLFSACGIAALGLLQSSVAVIIGAMLISPLMGPIMAMGMAVARLDPRAFRSAATTLVIGALLSVLASVLIIWISPLKDATPEILARTQPTLLDLIVALLSGFVGAYLTINRKGGAIAGVAIATALMPPLAVVGYGLATATWPIAGGAFLLFLTNVVSILGAVFGVARRYGFRPRAREGAAWETPALLAVMLLLCVPLAISLRSIVAEARETTRARTAINEAFAGAAPHITELKVDLQGKASLVQCVVVTRKYVPGAAQAIAKLLHPGSKVEVEQIVTAEGVSALAPPAAALGARTTVQATSTTPEQRLRAMLGPLGQVLGIEASDGALDIAFAMPGAELADYLATEQAAQRFSPGTTVRLIPPLAPLSPIAFAPGSSELTPEANRTLEIDAWALKRWGAAGASITAADAKPAKARAEAVALGLRARGVAAVSIAEPSKDGPADTVAIQPAPAA
ncbi:DUF389 domain-containing protein [Phenylobacterium sp.]|uniref:DUF389 domain-containing protein n=1 Tax=Phenylobacterium sp. TaxID=1871053 RepID=UPI0035B11F17